MALTLCPECSSQISDKAPACPSCGAPIDQPPSAQETATAAVGGVFAVGCLVFVAGFLYLLNSFLGIFE